MSDPDTPTAAERAAQVENLHRDAEKMKELLRAKERMTPEIEDLLRRADDAMGREAWGEVAQLYLQLAGILKQGGRWGDFDLDDILPTFAQGRK